MSQEKCYTLGQLAEKTQTTLKGDPHRQIWGASDLAGATHEEISFLSNPRYHNQMLASHAGAIVVSSNVDLSNEKNFLISDNPSRTFQEIVELFSAFIPEFTGFHGIHQTAVVHPTAKLAPDVKIGPYVVLDADCEIGARTCISAHAYIGPKVIIGEDCYIHPHVTVRESCVIGNRVILQPGAVIGSCGYGYTTDKEGKHKKLNQIGNVVLEDDVEIGANTTIDRARFKSTCIREGTKIDNLVQIAHGVVVGKHNFIIAQTGIAGSSTTGNHVILAGKVAVNGHIKICDKVQIAACSGVSKSITAPGKYAGVPVMTIVEHNKNQVYLRSIDKWIGEVKELKKKVHSLLPNDPCPTSE
jgi:UDP-3-O-[3-hydroxymyristoyl] glucosamine N-acyltransferase